MPGWGRSPPTSARLRRAEVTDGLLRVELDPDVAEDIAAAANRAAPRETGGLLLGWWAGEAIVVRRMVEVPDPEATAVTWTRRQRPAQAALNAALADLAHPLLGYVGDWHTHDDARDASPGDAITLARASRGYDQPLALVVHRPGGRIDIRCARHGRLRPGQLSLINSEAPA
jgi:proteasome lid subunit RPN8/RPN11